MRRTPLTRGSNRGPRTGRYDGRFALLLIAPAFFFYTIFLVLPLFGTVVIGFTDWTGINFATLRFTGLENFIQMAEDEFFWVALRNSFLFVFAASYFRSESRSSSPSSWSQDRASPGCSVQFSSFPL